MKKFLCLTLMLLINFSCRRKVEKLFTEVSTEAGIEFQNDLIPTESFNPYIFRSFYNGGGVAIGDIDNNGFQDIYFTGNQVPNKLYLNKGNWEFEEISISAGVDCQNSWTTGASFADVDQDGWVDLYVCKSGAPGGPNRSNGLYINNGDRTFTDKARAYGLDVEGLAVQAAFFDYDKDGDLDCYLLTNSFRSVGTGADLRPNTRDIPDISHGGNKLFRHDDGFFSDVTLESGIYSSAIGFGLGVTVSDFNYDSWPDIFVSNDFFEKDYLYINNKDGGFSEQGERYFNSMSLGSMGADAGDLNNDGKVDMVVTEMLPRDLDRKKTKAIYESWNKQQLALKKGYYYQYPRNMFHLGISAKKFAEVSRLSDVSNSEWSWGALVFDMDNDGLRDIYISNGIYQDLLDRDFLSFTANKTNIRRLVQSGDDAILRLLEQMPSEPVSNVAFRNNGTLSFDDASTIWGLNTPSFSNGSAYVDLDNDHDLDIVVNNVNQPSFVYRNNAKGHAISFKLTGEEDINGTGAKVVLKVGDVRHVHENFPVRGYQSSSTPIVHFGLGHVDEVDSAIVLWPSGKKNVLTNLGSNQLYEIREATGREVPHSFVHKEGTSGVFHGSGLSIEYLHQENDYVDFDHNNLLPEMYSNLGSRVGTTDLNNDGIDDFYFGGAKGQAGTLAISNGTTYQYTSNPFHRDHISEDMDAVFFDADGDEDMDLYVASGGTEFGRSSDALADRMYVNGGSNDFKKQMDALPSGFRISSSFVSTGDFDNDGDTDLLVGERFDPFHYGIGGGLHLLVNNGSGVFERSDKFTFDEVKTSYLLTDGAWTDLNDDNLLDIIAVGEWSPVLIFINEVGSFRYASEEFGLAHTVGWWNTMEVADVNGDGQVDIIAGNKGRNSFFKKGTRLNTSDFDGNGFIDNIISVKDDGEYYPIHDKDELVAHFPALKKQAIYYKDYAGKTTVGLFTKELLEESIQSEIDIVESSIFARNGEAFEWIPLPEYLQLSPIYAIKRYDVNKDGYQDLIVGGNQHNVKPQFGKYDALSAAVAWGSDNGFQNNQIVFTDIQGQVRDISLVKSLGKMDVLFFINNDSVKIKSIQ